MSDHDQPAASSATGRERKSRRRKSSKDSTDNVSGPDVVGVKGGRYLPLDSESVEQIDAAMRHILEKIGLSEAPQVVIERVTDAGGSLGDDGRLRFSATLIENALDGIKRDFSLHGQVAGHDLHLRDNRVHVGSGGAAPLVLDMETGGYRDSTLRDLYDAARLVDSLDNIHFFSRSLVARDIEDLREFDINTAYASIAGTRKHVFVAASAPEHVADIAEMCYLVAGSREAFEAKPFLSMNCNHAVPPLRFDANSCEIMAECARFGIPIHANTFGQLGASSPVTFAGCVAQTLAESIAGMIFAWLVNPAAKIVLGTRPMVTDLRTGGMAGGSGEQALLMAANTQMANYYGLANSTIAGATDSKVPDAQSGYEKSLAVSMVAHAGCNLITQACGMHASLMGVAHESYVIDNDMLGGIMRSLAPVKVDSHTLAIESIESVVRGEGHFLGEADTYARMQSDFLYPQVANRTSIDEWEADGRPDLHAIARAKTQEILSSHLPSHLAAETDAKLRERFPIRLAQSRS
ncbi:MAG: trimethylamine methyltransferase family protein [Pseudomonadota bacterium]